MNTDTVTNFGTTAPAPGSTDVLAYADGEGQSPDINALQQEYQYAWNQDPDVSSRIARAEDIRYTRWPGQSPDGLKHQDLLPEGVKAMPYDRAPDTRINLCDSIILSLVDVLYAAFWNARVKTAPNSASQMTMAQASELRAIISWMIHGPLRAKLINDVEFAGQVMGTVGWVVLHPVWRRKVEMRLQHLSMEQVLQLAAQAPEQSVLQSAPQLILDPTAEDAAVEVLRTIFPHLSARRARKVVKDLRQDGEADFPVPGPVMNVPELNVLVPWQDVILPIEATANPDDARLVFRRKFFTEARLKDRAREEDWDKGFVEEALKTKGQAMENGTSEEHDADANMQLVEIVYAYQLAVDDDGVPGIYCTVFSPHVQAKLNDTPFYGRHWLLDDGMGSMPFLFLTTEVTGRRPADARGVPDVLATAQQEMKQQRDATYVFSQMSVTPPLQKKGTQASKLPAELGPMGIINNTNGGEWSWFTPPPGKPEIAFKLIEDVRKEAQDYYGIPRADTPPAVPQTRQQRQVARWLSTWGIAFWQLAVLAYQNLDPEEMHAVIGRQPLLSADQVARHQLLLWFDVRALDPAWVESLLKAIAELILPADSAGVVDRAKLVQLALAYLDPTLAEEVTTDQEGAKQALFKSVRDEIGAIMQGNEAMYVENDPTAKAKLAFAHQIISSNPDYQMVLSERSPQFDPRKRELLEKWGKNLTQSALQQDNKTIGRLGVKPGG